MLPPHCQIAPKPCTLHTLKKKCPSASEEPAEYGIWTMSDRGFRCLKEVLRCGDLTRYSHSEVKLSKYDALHLEKADMVSSR